MTSISRLVKQEIDRDVSIQRELARGIINKTKLAKYLKKKIKIDADLEAYVSAVRRYSVKNLKFHNIEKLLLGSKIIIRNNKVLLELKNSSEVRDLLYISKKYSYRPFRVIKGEKRIKILGDQKELDKIKKELSDKDVIDYKRDVCEICVVIKTNIQKIPGVGAYMLNELALNNVTLLEISTCLPELHIIMEDSQAPRAYQVLQNMIKP